MCLDCGSERIIGVARTLAQRGARHVLIVAALEGRIEEVACAMPNCLCPEGRGYFGPEQRPWGISADRWPIPGRANGKYVPENVRVAHYRCNSAETMFKPGYQMPPEARLRQRARTSLANRGRKNPAIAVAALRWHRDPANAERVRQAHEKQAASLRATNARKREQSPSV